MVARGGSKGLPGKNVRPARRPAARSSHTIEAALGCAALDPHRRLERRRRRSSRRPRAAGCPAPFVRPAELAADRSSTVDVALHALDWLAAHEGSAADVVVLLPATAPLRAAPTTSAGRSPRCWTIRAPRRWSR